VLHCRLITDKIKNFKKSADQNILDRAEYLRAAIPTKSTLQLGLFIYQYVAFIILSRSLPLSFSALSWFSLIVTVNIGQAASRIGRSEARASTDNANPSSHPPPQTPPPPSYYHNYTTHYAHTLHLRTIHFAIWRI